MAKKKRTSHRISFTSERKNITKVEPFLQRVAECVRLDDMQMNKMMVSLTEAVNNAIVHGNKCIAEKRVSVQCKLLPGQLLLTVTDEGKGFNPEEISNPLEGENLLKESGRGVFLIRSLMDMVEFDMTKDGVRLHMWLNLNEQG